jgi:hypothetical protein
MPYVDRARDVGVSVTRAKAAEEAKISSAEAVHTGPSSSTPMPGPELSASGCRQSPVRR